VPRTARADLLSYLSAEVEDKSGHNLGEKAWQYLVSYLQVPRGIALPFSLQVEFLQSSWRIQQAIGRLKMALELGAKEIDSLCLELQRLIRTTRMSDKLRECIDEQIATYLAGVRSFVVRSSSNAEDLKDFSAAGIYESFNHVTTADKIFESIKEVWGSLVSPRSVRLRQEVGISLDDCYMGVIIQEEVQGNMGGVMVTTNPADPITDFRNVYINVSAKSATEVVAGKSMPSQYLYNTVEGGGRTLAKSEGNELSEMQEQLLQRLAFCGRLLQSHFSQDYAFSTPVDIEWSAQGNQLYLLQLRPYKV
jgi:phosphoenolpyruvate synthase/pyruvate phosphate dikinase